MNPMMSLLLERIAQSEKKSLAENKAKQEKQFLQLLQHARQTVPFYQHYPDSPLDKLPILTREQIQAAGKDLMSLNIPAYMGACYTQQTSGSTGKSVTVFTNDFTRLLYDALMLREHAWHQRDFSKKLMSIRWAKRDFAPAPLGHMQATWGAPINQYKQTGTSIFINVASPTQHQIEALLHYQPSYVLSYPSQLVALAQYCLDQNLSLPFLEEVRTTGETFFEGDRFLIKKAWPQVKISDVYSCAEMGILAQQCSEYENYHVNVENVTVEIVDEKGRACLPGQAGRVLLTSLMNYTMPLIRYDIGDYAQWGQPCACERGLPVIQKILGRKRNRLILPDGSSMFPYLGELEDVLNITTHIRKFQYIQHSVFDIECKLVTIAPLSAIQEEKLKKLIQDTLGYPFNVTLSYHENIPAAPNGKFEEFISKVELATEDF